MGKLLFSILILCFSSVAMSLPEQLEGVFAYAHHTGIVGYEDEKSCAADQGDWDQDMELCFFNVEDSVQVKKTQVPEVFQLNVDTVGSNGHSCSFEGEATVQSNDLLMSSVKTEVWQENAQTGEWESVSATCEVTVKYADINTTAVSTNGNCQEFCGMRAILDIEEAKRKAP